MDIKQCVILDRVLMDELNVKEIVRNVLDSDKGRLTLHFDGEHYHFMLAGEDVTSPRLLDEVPAIINSIWERTANNGH